VYRFQAKVEQRGESYVVTVPAVPGCVTGGSNREEALRKARELLQAILMQAEPYFSNAANPTPPPGVGGDAEYVEVFTPSLLSC
jgi:predicted RNase H-like HicB family nuclease